MTHIVIDQVKITTKYKVKHMQMVNFCKTKLFVPDNTCLDDAFNHISKDKRELKNK